MNGQTIRERFERVEALSDRFFEDRAGDVSLACRDLAGRFHRGGRLLAFGRGAALSDAYHVSVEFVHPVLVGRRALPALCLERDPAAELERLGRPVDIALGIASGPPGEELAPAFEVAREKGLSTVLLAGGSGDGGGIAVDHRFVVPSDDPTVVQEVQETLYHVLWELVHVFFDHPGLLERPAEAQRGGAA